MEKINKEEIDQLIEKSLTSEEAKFYRNLEEEGLWQKVGSLYTGKFRGIAILTAIVHTVAAAVSIYCVYKLFTVVEVVELIRYAAILFIAWSFGAMIKLWHWMQMDKNSILREMKRLEFQVAVLMEKTGSDKESTEIG